MTVNVYECDSSSEWYQVIWVDPTGQHRRSQTCKTHADARERAKKRHPDWPYAIVYEYRVETREVRERG